MKFEINIDDYVSEEEKAELCREYILETLRGDGKESNRERVLYNIAYEGAYKLLDDVLTNEDMDTIKTKVKAIINDKDAYGIFRKKNAWGAEDSIAWLEVKKAIEEHKHLISGIVKDVILSRDYEKDLNGYEDYFIETVMKIFKKGLQND